MLQVIKGGTVVAVPIVAIGRLTSGVDMDPLLTGALISAGGSLVSGLVGKESAEDQQAQNIAMQREFAQHGIRWKVEDAKAAGLHPLFALGGAGAAFAPNPVVIPEADAIAQAGQHLGRAAQASASGPERELVALQLQQARAAAAKDFAIAGYYDSERARNLQESGPVFPANVVSPGVNVSPLERQPALLGVPIPPESPVMPLDKWGQAEPLWKVYNFTDAEGHPVPVQLPAGSSASESLESVSESKALLAAVVARNLQVYGDSWYGPFSRMFGALFK